MKLVLLPVLIFSVFVLGQSLPYEEKFESGIPSEWTVYDDTPNSSGPSNWLTEDEILFQTSNIFVNVNEFEVHLGTHISFGDTGWKDFTINAIMRSNDNDGIGILFRYQNPANYYRVILMNDSNNGGPFRRLQKMEDGVLTLLDETREETSTPSGWFALSVDAREELLTIYINGEQILQASDERFKQGKAGFLCYANTGAMFDDLLVSKEKVLYEAPDPNPVTTNRNPYLQLPTENSILIAWRTKDATTGSVEYGLTSALGNTVIDDSSRQRHALQIDGLSPGTTYYYRVFNDGTPMTSVKSFRTKPAQRNVPLQILLWGDSGTGNIDQWNVAEQMKKVTADFGFHVGDVSQYNGEEYDNIYFAPYENIVNEMPIFTSIGNHDVYADNAATYLETFYLPQNNSEHTERYYSFTWGSTFFIALDSNIDFSPSSKQYEFLEDQLKSAEREEYGWVFVFFHHPPYCELWDSWDGDKNVRQYLMPLFESYSVDAVFNGHTHGYERGELNGVHYVISGGGGGGLDRYARNFDHIEVSIDAHHYSLISIDGETFTLKAVDISGNVIDEFSIVKEISSATGTTVPPEEFRLHQNFPNPFNPATTISVSVPKAGLVSLKVHSLTGGEIAELHNNWLSAGNHLFTFNAEGLASGIYFYSLDAGNFKETKQMLFLK